jgi:dUTP pyrophosphatase
MAPPPDTVEEEIIKTEEVKVVETSDSPSKKEAKIDVHVDESSPKLLFAKLSEHASAPTKGSKFAAGYDLISAYEYVIPKRGSSLVKTDIQIQLPAGTYGRIAARSGLALKNKIDVGAGVVDEDYRGNIGVVLFNHGDEDFVVAKGDRIAQLICEKICYPEVVEVKSLNESERGEQGFGSTGVKKLKVDDEVAA